MLPRSPANAEPGAALHLYVYSAVRFHAQPCAARADTTAATTAEAPPGGRSGSPGSHRPPPAARCSGGIAAKSPGSVSIRKKQCVDFRQPPYACCSGGSTDHSIRGQDLWFMLKSGTPLASLHGPGCISVQTIHDLEQSVTARARLRQHSGVLFHGLAAGLCKPQACRIQHAP